MNGTLSLGLLLGTVLATTACARAAEESSAAPVASEAPAPAQTSPAKIDPALPVAIVHKTASCGCCGIWVDHLKAAGFQVDVRDTDDMNPIKVAWACRSARPPAIPPRSAVTWSRSHPGRGHQAPAGRTPGRARAGAARHAGRFAGHGNAGRLRAAVHRRAGAHRRQHRAVCPARARWLTASAGAGRSDRHLSSRPTCSLQSRAVLDCSAAPSSKLDASESAGPGRFLANCASNFFSAASA